MTDLKIGSIITNKNWPAPFRILEHRPTFYSPCSYVLKNLISGWTFLAQNIIIYDDGSCEWDFSTDGHFEEV